MKMIRYATARLIYYKKQTILYCLFSSFSAFLLIACLTLYHLQSALANQVQDRLSFIGASASTELLPALELASRFYLKGIFSLFFLFAFFFRQTGSSGQGSQNQGHLACHLAAWQEQVGLARQWRD